MTNDIYLQFDDGTIVDQPGFGALGRKPRWESLEDTLNDEPNIALIQIDDPQRSLSRTHLAFGYSGNEFWVSDQGSANGTEVELPNGERFACASNRRVTVEEGSIVYVGDYHFWVKRTPA